MAKARAAKRAAMQKPGFQSRYARKREWLNAQPSPIPWGFMVPDPKPWK